LSYLNLYWHCFAQRSASTAFAKGYKEGKKSEGTYHCTGQRCAYRVHNKNRRPCDEMPSR